jgi:hypothetical protein
MIIIIIIHHHHMVVMVEGEGDGLPAPFGDGFTRAFHL